jgi:hypothetical protein
VTRVASDGCEASIAKTPAQSSVVARLLAVLSTLLSELGVASRARAVARSATRKALGAEADALEPVAPVRRTCARSRLHSTRGSLRERRGGTGARAGDVPAATALRPPLERPHVAARLYSVGARSGTPPAGTARRRCAKRAGEAWGAALAQRLSRAPSRRPAGAAHASRRLSCVARELCRTQAAPAPGRVRRRSPQFTYISSQF